MRTLKHLLLLTTLCLLTACVTTTTSGPVQSLDLKKAEETHIQLGLTYLRQQERSMARVHLNKALALNDEAAGAYNGLALLYQMEQQPDEAEKNFRRALKIDPSLSSARNNYSAFLFREKRYDEARKQLLIVAEDFNYARRAGALLNLARTEIKLGNTEEAIVRLKQTLALNFRAPMAHLELADIYLQKREYTTAKHYFDQYDKQVRQKNARSLLLGIRLESVFGNKDNSASYALALKNLYPYSAQYLEYKSMKE